MNDHSARFALRVARANQIATWMARAGDLWRVCELTLAPLFDLLLRLWLAQKFWVSGLLKVTNWQTALLLSANEYPVSWLDPVTAAYLGAAIEILCPIFLAVGLATRAAAVPLLALSLVIQYEYRALNEQVFWAVLFGWYVVMGAGALSLDRMIARGFGDSALPLAGLLSRSLAALTRKVGPYYRLFIRTWLALILAAPALSSIIPLAAVSPFGYQYQASFAATGLLPSLAPVLGVICPVLLVLGLATPVVAVVAALIVVSVVMYPGATALARIDYLYWLLLLGLVLLQGPGPLSLDHLIKKALRRVFPQLEGKPAVSLDSLPHVVIVGAGFGGISATRGLRLAACRVTLVDAHNYHLFQPLLYQVATAALSPADIAAPIRGLFRDQFNARVLLGRVTSVDTQNSQVIIGEQRLPYDYLVIATGARHAYFGRDEWESIAPGLKQIDDATAIRRRLLLAFERAENSTDPDEQCRLLTFIIVGGGATGVELAGAIAELARHGMERDFRNIDPAAARVMLIQAAPRLLPTFPEQLSAVTERSLCRLGVDVRTGSRVEHMDEAGVIVNGQRIESRTVFWAAGVMASPAAQWLNAESDSAGRIKVEPDLSVPGLANVYAIGDTALSNGWVGQTVPGLAPAAKQGGAYVAAQIRARIEGRKPLRPFKYRHLGSLATIGRKAAVADFGWLRVSGALAWWLWGAVHVLFLVGTRNRLSVAMQWFWAYLTFRSSTRLITGTGEPQSRSAVSG
ncbi:MAG: FAD-dependent oxidoreductase [Chromatiales bacterium]